MSWSINNAAHLCLWHHESWIKNTPDQTFTDCGEWSTDYLIGSAIGESSNMRSKKARKHALMLNDVFINLNRASYERGIDPESAINEMQNILMDRQKTMKDLGDIVDGCFKFRGEK